MTRRQQVDYLRQDLQAATDQFGKIAVVLLRLARILPGPAATAVDVLMRVLCGVEIPRSVEVGPGVRLAHGARGTVVHYWARIGAGVTLYHNVTLGVRSGDGEPPSLGDRAYVGAGACILGPVHVGSGASVGANAVVLADIPAYATAVGNPAKIVTRRRAVS